MHVIGFGRFQDRHFLGYPGRAAFLLQLFLQAQIDVAQMGDIGQRIFQLLLGQRAAAPVGKAGGFVDLHILGALHELVIGNRVAEATDHGRNLRVEDRVRDQLAKMIDDFQILTRAWKTLTTFVSAISSKKGARSRPLASGSTITSRSGLAIWIRHSSGRRSSRAGIRIDSHEFGFCEGAAGIRKGGGGLNHQI